MVPLSIGIASAALLAASATPPQPPQQRAGPPPARRSSPGTDEARRIFPFPMEEHRLPNGLRVVFVKFDSPGLVAYFSLVRAGSRNEVEPGHSGFAHFFEHMMFRGTRRHPGQQFDELLAKAGVENNAFTTDDFTAYYELGPSKALPLIIELESDRFQNLDYSEDDFKTEARAVLGEYNKSFSNPGMKMREVLADTAFAVHPYKHTTMGFKADIEAMPTMYEYSKQFFQRWYRPDNVVLIVVGDFDHAATLSLIQKAYGGWSAREAAPIEIPKEPGQASGKAVNLSWANPTQGRIIVAWRTPAARVDNRDSAIQNVLAAYLFGPTSPTYRDLVLERQLLTSLGDIYSDHRDPHLFGAMGMLKGDAFVPVRRAIEDAVARLRAGRVDLKRLADVKSAHKYGLLNSFDNPMSVGEALVFTIGPTGETRALDALFENIDALTAQDLVGFANTWLVPSRSTVVTVTGKGTAPPPGIREYAPAKPQATGGAR